MGVRREGGRGEEGRVQGGEREGRGGAGEHSFIYHPFMQCMEGVCKRDVDRFIWFSFREGSVALHRNRTIPRT